MMRQPDHAPREARVDPPLLLAFLLPVFAVAPLAYPGYFELRSGLLPIFALTDRLARLGDLAWVPAIGAAFSLLGGDGPLPYWLAALPAALGADGAAAVKWVMAVSLVAGSAGVFAWTRRRWADGWPALVAAAVYVLNPLTLALVYVEGVFASVVLLGLLPWTLWAADRALSGRRPWLVGLGVLVAATIWTQAALGLAWVAVLALLGLTRRVPGWSCRPPQQRACRHTGGAASRRAALASRHPEPWIWRSAGAAGRSLGYARAPVAGAARRRGRGASGRTV